MFSLYSPNRTSTASGDLSTAELCRLPFTSPAPFTCQGSWAAVPPPSPLLQLSTCLAKGLHSAEASFLCTRHKQLFLLSRLLMLPGELADHFLLTDITPPRNNSLPPSILLITKRHYHPHQSCISESAGAHGCQGQPRCQVTESPTKRLKIRH